MPERFWWIVGPAIGLLAFGLWPLIPIWFVFVALYYGLTGFGSGANLLGQITDQAIRRRKDDRDKILRAMLLTMQRMDEPEPKTPAEKFRDLQKDYEDDIRRITAMPIPEEDREQLLQFRRDRFMADIMGLME